jgi:hypothetical protein
VLHGNTHSSMKYNITVYEEELKIKLKRQSNKNVTYLMVRGRISYCFVNGTPCLNNSNEN